MAWAFCCALTLPAWAEPDEDALGKGQGYPIASSVGETSKMQFRVGSWSAPTGHAVPDYRSRSVLAGAQASLLPKAQGAVPIRYRHRNMGYSLDEYLERQRVTGLLILKNGEVVAEHYRYARTEDARFISFSMAKRSSCNRPAAS